MPVKQNDEITLIQLGERINIESKEQWSKMEDCKYSVESNRLMNEERELFKSLKQVVPEEHHKLLYTHADKSIEAYASCEEDQFHEGFMRGATFIFSEIIRGNIKFTSN